MTAEREPHGHHVGHRHLDPRHERGQWWVDRHDELPADQQGTGRPWRGARDNLPREGRSGGAS